jgi:hypothetical protein
LVSRTNRDKRRAKQKERLRRRGTGGDTTGRSAFGLPPTPSTAEMVAMLISAAIEAAGEGYAEGVRRCADALADPEATGEWALAVERGLHRTLASTVSALWRGGWQPADVARWAVREFGPRHARLAGDAMAAELRSYAAATVDETFHAQLAALDARVWWGSDDSYLAAFAGRERIELPAAVLVALQVICLLTGAPVLPVLCPPPGSARQGSLAARPGVNAADEKILARVRALLAKAESTNFPSEAEAFTAGAQKLMARHSIDYALLAHRTGVHDRPTGRRIAIDNPYENPKAALLNVIAGANRCRMVWSKEFGFGTVLGFPGALAAVEVLFTSLLVQATAAMTQAGSQQAAYGRARSRSFRQSFLAAYASRIGQRLDTASREAVQEAVQEAAATAGSDQSLLPVLADRDQRVDEAMAEMFPRTTETAVGRSYDAAGWASGTAAADRAQLSGHRQVAAGTAAGGH